MNSTERFVMTLDEIIFHPKKARNAGGPGSGNFGHKGRPGKQGGSIHDSDPSIDRSTWHEHTSDDAFFGQTTSRSDLPLPLHQAAHSYVVVHSFNINRALRAGGLEYPQMRNGKVVGTGTVPQETIDNLDAAVQTDEATEDLTVFRSLDEGIIPETLGTVFSDKAYVSTSSNQEKADYIGNMFATKAVTWEIELPRSTKFLDISKHFDSDTDTANESEILLGRNSRFEVVGPRRLRLLS